ncbi:MAG: right-handed parallel beta-helix repeat-containing protein [Promethearchaeota archaeon]
MKQIFVVLLTLSLLMIAGVGILSSASRGFGMQSIMVSFNHENTIAQYQSHASILIESNADFAALGASGVGTPSEPYTFENLQISAIETCIEVRDTTAYFVILNCKLTTAEVTNPVIRFLNVENGRIEQCEVNGGASGLELNEAMDCSAIENSFYGCYNGLLFFNSANCTITENKIHNNQVGVKLDWTEYCDILNNTVYSNFEFGIEIASNSDNNTCYGNSIGWNHVRSDSEQNAIDNGEDNLFDDGSSIGNLWTDFNESEPYQVYGDAATIDHYAGLMEDNIDPVIVPQYDTVIDVESVGNSLTWLVGDEFPASFIVEEDDVQVILGVWNGDQITIDLDHLSIGIHEVTVTIYDGAGNEASDGVLVSVVSFILGGIGTELVMIASAITVASFLIIVALMKRLS